MFPRHWIVDTVGGKLLSLAEQFTVLTKANGKKDGEQEHAGLAKKMELAIGMQVMVTWNVQLELDVANGARGE